MDAKKEKTRKNFLNDSVAQTTEKIKEFGDRDGWIKMYRKVEKNPIVCKDNDYFRVWHHLLYNANHTPQSAIFKKQKIKVLPGQFVTGRKLIATACCVSEFKVERILKWFENDQQIEQQKTNKGRLITIVNWNKYQNCEQQNTQQMHKENTTNTQQMHTIKECKNIRIKEKNKYIVEKVVDYLNQKANKNFKANSKDTIRHINARLSDGYTLANFKSVIDNQTSKWLNTSMEDYLRPSTLFGSKFESYLNSRPQKELKSKNTWEEVKKEFLEEDENDKKGNN